MYNALEAQQNLISSQLLIKLFLEQLLNCYKSVWQIIHLTHTNISIHKLQQVLGAISIQFIRDVLDTSWH